MLHLPLHQDQVLEVQVQRNLSTWQRAVQKAPASGWKLNAALASNSTCSNHATKRSTFAGSWSAPITMGALVRDQQQKLLYTATWNQLLGYWHGMQMELGYQSSSIQQGISLFLQRQWRDKWSSLVTEQFQCKRFCDSMVLKYTQKTKNTHIAKNRWDIHKYSQKCMVHRA